LIESYLKHLSKLEDNAVPTGREKESFMIPDVADLIERFVAGHVGKWEWDDFISVTWEDPDVEAARIRCAAIQDEFPARAGYCSPEGIRELLGLALRLRRHG
jgi:hypothetical protein